MVARRRFRKPRKGKGWTEQDQREWEGQLAAGEHNRRTRGLIPLATRRERDFMLGWEQRTQQAREAFALQQAIELEARDAEGRVEAELNAEEIRLAA